MNPRDARVMYAAMREELFRSADGGARWALLAAAPKNLAAVALNPARPEEVHVATVEGQIFRSADGGTSWERRR